MDEVGTGGTEVATTLGSGTGMSVESGTAGIEVSVGRTGTEEGTEEIEGRAWEMLSTMEETSTWMEEATSEEMGIGKSVGTGRDDMDMRLGRTLGRTLGKPLGRTVGRTVEKPLGRLMLGTLWVGRVVPFNSGKGRVPLRPEGKNGKMVKLAPPKLERRLEVRPEIRESMEVELDPKVVPLNGENPRKREEEGSPLMPVKFMVLLVPVRPLRMGGRYSWRKLVSSLPPWSPKPRKMLKLKGPTVLRLPLKPGNMGWVVLLRLPWSGKVAFCLLAINCELVDRA